MSDWRTMADIRREYGDLSLKEDAIDSCPIVQFKRWFEEVAPEEKTDPTAMVLSTVDKQGHPDSRVVLLKGLNEDGFVFYTNYQSVKSTQISHNPYVALNFYWPQMSRQVRIRGQIKQVSSAQSNAYFASRPVSSQFSAILSPQSQEITDRKEMEYRLNQLIAEHGQEPIIRPNHWGGYVVTPFEIEFWQGRDNRLHDRILYYKKNEEWGHRRLAP